MALYVRIQSPSLLPLDVKSILLSSLSGSGSFSSLSQVHYSLYGAFNFYRISVRVFSISLLFMRSASARAHVLGIDIPLRAPRRYDHRWHLGIFVSEETAVSDHLGPFKETVVDVRRLSGPISTK